MVVLTGAYICGIFIRRNGVRNVHRFHKRLKGTCFALSSGTGKCGVAVLRISGPGALQSLKSVTARKTFRPRFLTFGKFYHPKTMEILDQGLSVWFPGPHTFTGEDSCEFHCHGSTAVISAMLQALGSLPGLHPADPGEFTRRAFMNGKLDLTEVEGLADLIHSETDSQRRLALRQLDGNLNQLYCQWTDQLKKYTAQVDAYIDFSESEDIEDDTLTLATSGVEEMVAAMEQHLADGVRGERLRDGVQVAIVGPPNAGKSTLLNYLCRRQAAITSPEAGTTRDVLEVRLDVGGYPVLVCDTAGIREGSLAAAVEREGMLRARVRADHADLLIVVLEHGHVRNGSRDLSDTLREMNLDSVCKRRPKTMFLINKCDQIPESRMSEVCDNLRASGHSPIFGVSITRGDGMKHFVSAITESVASLCSSSAGSSPLLTRERHRNHVDTCVKHLKEFLESTLNEEDIVMSVESLKRGLQQLGHITGRIHVNDILDSIFKDFCIGK